MAPPLLMMVRVQSDEGICSVGFVNVLHFFLGRHSGGGSGHGRSIAPVVVDSSRCLCDGRIPSILFICGGDCIGGRDVFDLITSGSLGLIIQ